MKTIKSAKIVQFPRFGRDATPFIDPSGKALNASKDSKPANNKLAAWKRLLHGSIGLVWLFVGMLWPLTNGLVILDVLFQWSRALFYSNTPAIHTTLQAGIHTTCYLLLSAFIYLYRPKVF